MAAPFQTYPIDLPNAPATVGLAKRIGRRRAHYLLLDLWAWGMRHSRKGFVSGETAGDAIEHGAGWTGKRGLFVEAALAEGWLEQRDEGIAIVHWKKVVTVEWAMAANGDVESEKAEADRRERERVKKASQRARARGGAMASVSPAVPQAVPAVSAACPHDVPEVSRDMSPSVPVENEISSGEETKTKNETESENASARAASPSEGAPVSEGDTRHTPDGPSLRVVTGEGQRPVPRPQHSLDHARSSVVILPSADTRQVWEHYVRTCDQRANEHNRRHEVIQRALDMRGMQGQPLYSAEALCQSLSGKAGDPFYNGKKDGTRRLRLDVLLKDPETIDEGLRLYQDQQQPRTGPASRRSGSYDNSIWENQPEGRVP